MKKLFLLITVIVLAMTTVLLSACSDAEVSDEEKFAIAKEALENYTVDIEIEYLSGTKYNITLYVDGDEGKLVFTDSDGDVETEYYTETDADSKTIEEHFKYSDGDVGIFQLLLSSYFEKDDEWYVCSDVGLDNLSDESIGTIDFAKVQFKNNKFYKATVAMSFFGDNGQINYTFYNYGKTKV